MAPQGFIALACQEHTSRGVLFMAQASILDPRPSAADLRADLARANVPRYRVAARVPINPSALSAVLNEKAPLSPEMAARIAGAIAECAAQNGGAQ